MNTTRKIAILLGSLRAQSLNRKLTRALIELAPPSLSLELVEVGDLPLYNQDLEEQPPPTWLDFRERIRAMDGILFVTPEYNRSMPGGLKNAIDVGSRPYGKSVWDKKPAGVVTASPGQVGGFGANHHLRQSLVFLNMPVLQQPEMYLGGADKFFDADGKLTAEKTRELLGKFLQAYSAWVERHLS